MERQPGQCPFLKQECIKERCELWGAVELVRPGQLAGSLMVAHARGCALNLLVLALSQPRLPVTPGQHGPDVTKQ